MLRLRSLTVVLLVALVIPAPAVTVSAAGAAERRPLRFVLDTPLHEGGKTRVRLRNTGTKTYIYNSYYEACEMVFLELPSRRKFIVPEGTHCDLVVRDKLAPGETVTLFRWDLDECIEDNWGCDKARDLQPGRYLMKGWFRPKGGGDRVTVRREFRIRR